MQFPFTVVVQPPSRAGLRRLLRAWWPWALAGALLAAAAAYAFVWAPAHSIEPGSGASLQVESVPDGASVEIDGRTRGRTPASLTLAPGAHTVRLRRDGYADVTHSLTVRAGEAVAVTAQLWLRSPQVQRLRPTFPGATISAAGFLRDGRVALIVALPPGDERQAWLVDGRGGTRRVGPPEAHGGLAISPDGEQVAYLAQGQGGRLDEVWLTRDGSRGARRYAVPTGDERLVDLTWAPDGRHLLVVSQQPLAGGGQRTRLRWLDTAAGEARELVELPSEVVPGSYGWSPGGDAVAFLARAGQLTALCLVRTTDDTFQYLADLSRDDPSPLPFPPVAWSPDGRRLLYAAPNQDRAASSGWLFGAKPPVVLFLAEAAQPLGQPWGVEGQAPAWRHDGGALALGRGQGSALVLRAVAPGQEPRDLAEVPVRIGSAFAARWDVAHAQLLVATNGSAASGTSQPEYWLVRFRPEGGR